jgi:two-component sensor histidine kinase
MPSKRDVLAPFALEEVIAVVDRLIANPRFLRQERAEIGVVRRLLASLVSQLRPCVSRMICLVAILTAVSARAGDYDAHVDGSASGALPEDPLAGVVVFEDVTGNASISEVAANDGGAWRPIDHLRSLSFGYTRSAHWLRFPIGTRFSSSTNLLVLENPFVDSVTLYWPRDGGGYERSEAGAGIAVSKRGFPHRYPILRLGPFRQHCAFAYLRLATTDVAVYPMRLMSEEQFQHADHDEQMILGIYYGALVVMLFFNLFVFFYLREALYIVYAAFIASFAIFQAVCNGLANEYVWPNHGGWHHVAVSITCGLATYFAIGTTVRFMDVRTLSPRLLTVARIGQGACVVLLPAAFLSSRIAGALGTSVGATAALLALAVGIVGLARRHKPTAQFLLAGVFLVVGVLLNALRNFGVLGDSIVTTHGHQIGSALLVVLLTLALLARFDVLRREKERAQAESLASREQTAQSLRLSMQFKLQALQAKINPHFLFNALNTIDGLIAEDPSRASHVLHDLSRLFRHTLAVTESERVSLRQEIEIVRTYLEIEKARFGDRIRFRIETSGNVDAWMIPGLTLQPLVENSIKHGLSPKVEGGTIIVRAEVDDDESRLVVADDGIGIVSNDDGRGHGLANVRERLRLAYGEGFTMDLSSHFGTRVEIRLPRWPK